MKMNLTNQKLGKYLKSLKTFLKPHFMFTRTLYRGLPKLTITPAVSYKNAKINKSLIFKDNKDKAFVYRWINKINGKEYLGSTSNAKKRLNTYFNLKTLGKINMPIYNAILKHGHENFTFEIIEFCLSNDSIEREQYYLDNFDFEYNVLAKADSLAGYKHTTETIAKLKGRQNLLGYKHLPETIEMLREINKAKVHTEEDKEAMRDSWAKRKLKSNIFGLDQLNEKLPLKTKKLGKVVVATNIETNVSIEYKSISEAATSLNLTRVTLRKYIQSKEILSIFKHSDSALVKEKYLITLKDRV